MQDMLGSLYNLGGSRYFSKIDLTKAYFQCKLEESCRDVTSFSTSMGSFRWSVIPQGLKSSPATFQRAMMSAFGELTIASDYNKGPPVIVYLDDILIR